MEIKDREYELVAGVLIEPAGRREDDESDLDVAEQRELEALLQQPIASLGEGHLPRRDVLDPLQFHLPPPHHPSRSPGFCFRVIKHRGEDMRR